MDPTHEHPNLDSRNMGPVPSRSRKVGCFFLLGVLTLVTLGALLYAVENARGWRAWQKERERLARLGEPLSWQELLPPPPAEELNFAAAPIYREIFETADRPRNTEPDATAVGPSSLQGVTRAKIDLSPPGYRKTTPELTVWMRGQGIDLEKWAQHFQQPEHPDQVIHRFPASSSDDAAVQVLRALELYEATFRAVEDAASRPPARFPIRYEEHINVMMPHLDVLRSQVRAVVLRGVCRLRVGQTEAAFADFLLAQRLAQALREEPLLISQLVRSRLQWMALQIVYEGLLTHQWNFDQLTAIDRQLAGLNFLADWKMAIRGERLLAGAALEDLRQGRTSLVLGSSEEMAGVWQWGLRWIPDGWIWQNMARLSRHSYELAQQGVHTDHLTVDWVAVEQMETSLTTSGIRPYTVFVRLLGPPLLNSLQRVATAQAGVHLARTATALERHRLQQGQYPGSMEALGGQALWQIDPFDARPLRYRCDQGRAYLLYSIGPDRSDDGGQPMGASRPGRRGDLLWRVPTLPPQDR